MIEQLLSKSVFIRDFFVDSAIYELFYSAVTDSFLGDFVWPHAVLVTESTLYVRGASVFDLGTLVFLFTP